MYLPIQQRKLFSVNRQKLVLASVEVLLIVGAAQGTEI